MNIVKSIFALILSLCISVPAIAEQVKARLVADVETIEPGTPFRLGVLLTIPEHAHIYWRNPGTSGLATGIEWDLPEGFTVGELQWPNPQRFEIEEIDDITYEARRVEDGDILRMGEVDLEVVHVPGHRPEQINLLVRDRSRGEEPWCILTADFLLVGAIARPDLAQGGMEGARVMFDQALPKLRDLPDFVEVYPGHVAGST